MQEEARKVIATNPSVVLLSPTGTGKTVAFLLPVIAELRTDYEGIQALILVPSRELAIQIEQVLRQMGTGLKTNAVYGGRAFTKDLIELQTPPAILVGTPGRVADHLRRESFRAHGISHLVLDEFDKSLEVGFEAEMRAIIEAMPRVRKKILTSATEKIEVPEFVGLRDPERLNYLSEGSSRLEIKRVLSPTKNKLGTLVDTLHRLGNAPGIIFCNYKDTIQFVSHELKANRIAHGCFHGDMEQKDRERALIKFRNGTHQVIVATDLAARGLDIPELDFIIHFQLPNKEDEFTHRNGRTARMNSKGTAFVLHWEGETLRDFIGLPPVAELPSPEQPGRSPWTTLFISGGRKDKISKGDIVGLFFKQGGLQKDELGVIELKQDCAFVGVHASRAQELIDTLNNTRLKKKKVRIYEL